MIGHNIAVMIVEIRGDKVRLGISAPRELPVHRQEIFDKLNGLEHAAQETDRPDTGGNSGTVSGDQSGMGSEDS